MEIEQLVLPELSLSKYFGFDSALRPYRIGGPRYDIEQFQNKQIFHNYGHAGYGITILYGMVNQVVQNFLDQNIINKKIAILGSGYYGLLTAILLQQKGYQVTIYAKKFPLQKLNFKDFKITSQVAGGLIFLYLVDDKFKKSAKKYFKQTLQYYQNRIDKKQNKGLYNCPLYFVNLDPIAKYQKYIPKDTLKIQKVKIQFQGSLKIIDAFKVDTIFADGDTFLNELYQECIQLGVIFKNREFKQKQDLIQLKEQNIFNCLGYESKFIFNDQKFQLTKGHLLYFTKPQNLNYCLKFYISEKKEFSIYSQLYKQAVGLTRIEEEVKDKKYEQKYVDEIYERRKIFLNYIQINPKL